jgi:hypothetical protein
MTLPVVTDPCMHIGLRVVTALWSRRSSDKRRFERGQAPAASTGVSGASAVATRAACQRARRDGRRRPKNRTLSASVPRAHHPLESGPRAALLPQRAGSHPIYERCWYATAHSCATSDTKEGLCAGVELRPWATSMGNHGRMEIDSDSAILSHTPPTRSDLRTSQHRRQRGPQTFSARN